MKIAFVKCDQGHHAVIRFWNHGCFTGIGAIVRLLPQCLWSNAEGYGCYGAIVIVKWGRQVTGINILWDPTACNSARFTAGTLAVVYSTAQGANIKHAELGIIPYHRVSILHDDVIKWKHFPRYWPFVRGIHRSPVNSPHKGQWRGAFDVFVAWINGCVNNG